MNIKDYFKKSVWESFMNSQTMTEDVVLQIVIAMSAALILGLFIYKIYQIYFGGVVFSRSFATTLVGMTVLTCMLTLAISRRFDYTRVFGSGGMPSSHSSMACAMLMVVGLHEGFSSAVFALAFCFAGVTMYDAAGVRRSTGRNAAVINHIVEGLSGKGFNFDDEHLKELVGHTPIQVLAGALLGILVGVLMA